MADTASQVRVPGFLPSTAGFHFDNNFPAQPDLTITIPPAGQIGIGDASNGLCGGMAYSVRDYFEAGLAIPTDTNPPTSGILFDFIVRRLLASYDLPTGPLRYMELMNPLLPDDESAAGTPLIGVHGRAWRMITQEWPLVKADLDSGHLSPLGLIKVKSLDPRQMGECHQVLAYGYDLDGTHLTIHLYDPNYHNNDNITMAFDLADPQHTTPVTYSHGQTVYCFFRTAYTFWPPPALNAVPGHVFLFDGRDFSGRYKDVQSADPDISASDDGYFDNRVSSLVVLTGNWTFYRDTRFANPYLHNGQPLVLGPGLYHSLPDVGLASDDLSSLKAVADPPNQP